MSRMPVKHFELLSIDGRRFSKFGEKPSNIRVNHNSQVVLINEISNREAGIDFRFTANYVGMGVINIEGKLVYEGDASAIVKLWAESRRMPDEVAKEVHGVIINNCIPEAMIIARDIRLPPPIPIQPPKISGKGRPSTGVEVA